MSTTYRVSKGDSFDSISRKVYGTQGGAQRIATANPGAIEPLSPGVTLVIPDDPNAVPDRPSRGGSVGVNECALLLNGERFRFWDSVTLRRSIDSVDTMEFTAPFDPSVTAQRAAFRPFSYQPVEFTVGGVQLFKGTTVTVTPEVTPESTTVTVGGYAKPGVLGDCTLPASAYPRNEFIDQTLDDIARSICGHFGLAVSFEGEVGDRFDRVAIQIGMRCMGFLAELARQRNLVIGSNPAGALVFRNSTTGGNPVARLQTGASPLVDVIPMFRPQEYYSHVTGIEPVIPGTEGLQYTAKNRLLDGVVRPFSFTAPDVAAGAVQTATEAKIGRMFGNMAAYSATVSTWRDVNGELWTPNTTVELMAPGAMVYSPYKFIIRSVDMTRTKNTEEATLDLVLPGAFDGTQPETLPWD